MFAHLCTMMSRMHQQNKGYPFDSLVDFARRFYGTSNDIEVEATNVFEDKTDVAEDSGQQVDYDKADREGVVEQTENQVGDTEAIKDEEAASALALITPGWVIAFASSLAAMSFAMIAVGSVESKVAPPTPTINIHLKRDSSTLLERKSNKLHTFLSFQESLKASKKSSADNLKDKAAARAVPLAVARNLK
nr:hypothetical protein [Tanacetum cinerariifolium]